MHTLQLPTIASRAPRTRSRTPAEAPVARPAALVAAPPHRAVVRPRVVIDAINRDLSGRPECAGLAVSAGRWHITHASGACNWSEASLVIRVVGDASPTGMTELRKAIARAKLRYDVFAPEAYLG